MFIQTPVDTITYGFANLFVHHKEEIPKTEVALVVESFGGNGEAAYIIAHLLRTRCGAFTAIVPRFAKSAATLLCLGAKEIILGDDGELGPLDAQFFDADEEEDMVSALDTVQAVEQLEDSAIEVAMKMLEFLHDRTKKKYDRLMEPALHFAAEITQPLFQKIDAVAYSRQHRRLREAQVYAQRLLQPRFTETQAEAIAHDLVTRYPTHAFVINREEAKNIGEIVDPKTNEKEAPVGLHVIAPPSDAVRTEIDWLRKNISGITAMGQIESV